MSGAIVGLWRSQPKEATHFIICTKSASGLWEEHFFKRDRLSEVKEFLAKVSKRHDVYFCPHGFTRPRRLKEYAVLPTMLWADLDEVDPRNLGKLKPTIAIESSPGRFVGLWITDEQVTEELNRRLTYHINADRGGWDLTQVLRVPNTRNFKYETTPTVKLLWDDGPEYEVASLERRIPKVKVQSVGEGGVADVLKKYPDLPRELMTNLFSDRVHQVRGITDRSKVLWKLGQQLVNEGVTPDDLFVILKACKWNKFKERPHSEDRQLEREVRKLFASKGRNNVGETYHDEDEEEEEEKKVMEKGKRPKLFTESLAEVEEETKEWIWFPFLARGEVTIMEGEPNCGKSYACQMIAKAICDGEQLPVMKEGTAIKIKGKVMYCDVENDKKSTTKPRMRWNGLKNMENYYQEDFPFTIDQKDMMRELYRAIEKHEPELIVFDTLNHYIGERDTSQANQMAQAITETFRDIARRFECAVIIIRHWRKSGRKEGAKNQGQGSIAILGTVRIVIGVADNPEDSGTKRLFLIKNNHVGPFENSRALEMHIRGIKSVKEWNKSKAEWGDYIEATAEELVQAEPGGSAEAKSMTEDAINFLYALADDADEMKASEIVSLAEKRSISVDTLTRASRILNIKKERRYDRKNGDKQAFSVWMLDALPAVKPGSTPETKSKK